MTLNINGIYCQVLKLKSLIIEQTDIRISINDNDLRNNEIIVTHICYMHKNITNRISFAE